MTGPRCGCPVEVVALNRADRRRAGKPVGRVVVAVEHLQGCPFDRRGRPPYANHDVYRGRS